MIFHRRISLSIAAALIFVLAWSGCQSSNGARGSNAGEPDGGNPREGAAEPIMSTSPRDSAPVTDNPVCVPDETESGADSTKPDEKATKATDATDAFDIAPDSIRLDDVVAVVKGEQVLMRHLLAELLAVHGEGMLEDLTTKVLVKQEWTRLGISVTPEEIERRIEQEIALHRSEFQDQYGDKVTLEAFLSLQGHDLDSFKELLRTNANFANQMILERWFAYENLVRDKVEVQHILVDTEEAANAVLEKARAGADFAKLAEESSVDDLTARHGGKLDPFVLGASPLGLEFDRAAFALQRAGDLSDLVKTPLGIHVIRFVGRIKGSNEPYDSVKKTVIADLDINLPDKEILRRWYNNYRRDNSEQIEIRLKKK
ncbi:MAG: peptidylprolyl isomerase [Planctomycetota bacterium]|nr:peptidylprolyl isomerase [Planctomycetota bacterium]